MSISPIGCDDIGVIKEMADIWEHGNQLQKTKQIKKTCQTRNTVGV